jgi:hypothetical protein
MPFPRSLAGVVLVIVPTACSNAATSPASSPDGGQVDQDAANAVPGDDAVSSSDGATAPDATAKDGSTVGSPDAGSSGSSSDGGSGSSSDAGAKPLGFTPWLLLDAEKATLGQKYEGSGSDQWSSADGATVGDATHVFEGHQSFKMHADKGTPNNSGEYGNWGGIKSLPSVLHQGDTLHGQVALYLPTNFDWSAGPQLKFLRVHTADGATQNNRGYHDIEVLNGAVNAGQDGVLTNGYEGTTAKNYWVPTTATLTKGQWNVVEFAITFDAVSVDAGGKGRLRVWYSHGGHLALVLDRTDSNTLTAATDIVDGFFVFTYWNSWQETGQFPTQSQDCWVDRVVLENDESKLVETDAQGNKIIGGLAP